MKFGSSPDWLNDRSMRIGTNGPMKNVSTQGPLFICWHLDRIEDWRSLLLRISNGHGDRWTNHPLDFIGRKDRWFIQDSQSDIVSDWFLIRETSPMSITSSPSVYERNIYSREFPSKGKRLENLIFHCAGAHFRSTERGDEYWWKVFHSQP